MRTWLYDRVRNSSTLAAHIAPRLIAGETLTDRVSQGETMQDRLTAHPYIFYTIGNRTSDRLSELSVVYTQFFQIYVHDKPSDYTWIDEACRLIIRDLQGAGGLSGAYDIMEVQFLELSRDLDDTTLGTIMRYIRFSATVKEYTDG